MAKINRTNSEITKGVTNDIGQRPTSRPVSNPEGIIIHGITNDSRTRPSRPVKK